MKKAIPVLTALLLILIIVGGSAGYSLYEKYSPSKEPADLAQIYRTEGDEPAIIYNYVLQSERALSRDGQSYLPLSWINEWINERFYWDSNEELLVYALPDEVVYADLSTAGSNGKPLIIKENDEVWLSLGLIVTYSDVEVTAFDDDDTQVKRIFVSDWGTRTQAEVTRDTRLRERGGIKSPVQTDIPKGSEVTVLEVLENWSRVVTPDGYIGYVENRYLSESFDKDFEGDFVAPVYGWTGFDGKVVLGWHQVTSTSANSTLESVVADTDGLNVISPTWFSLSDNEGNYTSIASKEYVDKAHEMGLEVWALIDNFSDNVRTEVLLSSTSTRKKLIDSLIADAEYYGLDGINIDFEGLNPAAGTHFIEFLRELSIPCRQKGIILSVDNYVPTEYSLFYNRPEQANVVDYVIIMGYDEHYAGSEAGSTASIEFVDGGILNTIADVPNDHVILGVPFYTRLWTVGSEGTTSRALGIAEAKNWAVSAGIELIWDEELGQFYGELPTSSGEMQYIWMEEENSLGEKMSLVRHYDLAGVACWKLGLEDAAVWDVIGF